MPRGRFERLAATLHRSAEARVAFDPVIVEATAITHPVAVDLGIEPRRDPNQARTLCPLGLSLEPPARVAALRAQRAYRIDDIRVVPRAALEAVIARGDGAHRAHVHQVPREQRVHPFFLERRDFTAVA